MPRDRTHYYILYSLGPAGLHMVIILYISSGSCSAAIYWWIYFSPNSPQTITEIIGGLAVEQIQVTQLSAYAQGIPTSCAKIHVLHPIDRSLRTAGISHN